jgi:PAS domain S-box-containing protein
MTGFVQDDPQTSIEQPRASQEELRRRAEQLEAMREELEDARRRYEDLFSLAPDAYLVTDGHGFVTEANKAASDLLGEPSESLVGDPLTAYISPAERRRFRSKLSRLTRSGGKDHWELSLQPRNGHAVAVDARVASIVHRNAVAGFRWLLRDVTARRRSEDEVRRENIQLERRVRERTRELRRAVSELGAERDRLKRLLQRLDEGVIAVSPELHTVFANDVARGILGPALEPGAALPEPWTDLPLRELVKDAFEEDAEQRELEVRPDEDHTYVVVVVPARAAPNVLVLVRDVSEQERRERAEREFVTNAAHELRTPLAAITSAIEVLQQGAKDDPEQRDRFLTHVERETARLARLARALLVLARVQTRRDQPRTELIAVQDLLADVAAGLPLKQDLEVKLECPEGLALLANRDLVEQALANLAGNAAKYTSRGLITLSAAPVDGDGVALTVEDTGPGMEPSEQERVFERFYRAGGRSSEGTSFGLGLAIVEQSVEALGGKVELQSQRGGTRATILLSHGGKIRR